MSRRLGQRGDGKRTNRTTIALGITIAVVAAVALSIPVGYVMAGTIDATNAGQGQTGDAPLQTGAQGNYSVHQGGNCTAVVPVAGNESVKAFYDYRTPFGENEFTNATGNSYSSEGTTALQEPNASVLFLYEGPTGNLSLVAVHGALNETSRSGSVSYNVTGLPENGTWEVKDDEYDDPSSFDNWTHEDGNASIDWSWGEGRTDGFAFGNLSDSFNVTIEPAFDENATLYGEYYNGTVANWSVVSNVSVDRTGLENVTTYNRTALNMSQNVTISASACGALSSGAPAPPGADDGTATGETDNDPVGGGAEPPAGGDDDQTEQDDDTDNGDDAGDDDADDADDDDADDADDDNGDAGDDGDTDDGDDGETDDDTNDGDDDDTQSPDSIELDIDWNVIGPEETDIPVTVTANYGDTTEEVTDEATITSSNETVATVDGSLIDGVAEGEVDITASFDEETDSESLSVEDNEPDSELEGLAISLEDDEIAPDESTTVSVEADTPVDTQDVTGDATIESEDPDVAEVEGSNVVASSEGEAMITAEYSDGTASTTITVTANDDTDGNDANTDGNDVDTGDDAATDDGNGATNGTGDGTQSDTLVAASSDDDGDADETGGPPENAAVNDDDQPGAGIAQSESEQEDEESEQEDEESEEEEEADEAEEEQEDEDQEEPDDDSDESTLLDELLS